jgi:hypothetical protein
MTQHLFTKITHCDRLRCKQVHVTLAEPQNRDAVSDSAMCYWSGQFLVGREYVECARSTGSPFDFGLGL